MQKDLSALVVQSAQYAIKMTLINDMTRLFLFSLLGRHGHNVMNSNLKKKLLYVDNLIFQIIYLNS